MAKLTAGGKKRYNVTLTPAIVERFQSLCNHFGLPPATMSHVIDDSLAQVASVFQVQKDQGKFDLSDVFKLMGKQIELFEDEGRKNANTRNNRKSV